MSRGEVAQQLLEDAAVLSQGCYGFFIIAQNSVGFYFRSHHILYLMLSLENETSRRCSRCLIIIQSRGPRGPMLAFFARGRWESGVGGRSAGWVREYRWNIWWKGQVA